MIDLNPSKLLRLACQGVASIPFTVGIALCLAPEPAHAAERSIVGYWSPVGSGCRPMDGTIAIQPLGLVSDEMRCTFPSVVRAGNVVTWKGKCGFPENDEPATVVASTQGDTLILTINGGRNGPYRRCKAYCWGHTAMARRARMGPQSLQPPLTGLEAVTDYCELGSPA